jgi:DNA repair exonuclease SbcCD ATPase subunit
MLKSVRLKNFQCHSDFRIDFDEKITAITGPSDVGKSSVIRSLRWLSQNRPLGSGIIKDGEECSSVFVSVDGVNLRRDRSKSRNSYSVKRDGEVDRMDAVGTDVPEVVQDILNLGPENFQGQHDSPFWFCLSAGDVAKNLNRITNLELIDSSIEFLNNRVRKSNAKVEVCRDRVQEDEKVLLELDYVPDMADDFNILKSLYDRFAFLEELESDVRVSVEQYNEILQTIVQLKKFIVGGEDFLKVGNDLIEATEEGKTLSQLVCEISDLQNIIEHGFPDISDLQDIVDRMVELESDSKSLKNEISTAKFYKQKVKESRINLGDDETEFTEKLDGKCPVCGGNIDVDNCCSLC